MLRCLDLRLRRGATWDRRSAARRPRRRLALPRPEPSPDEEWWGDFYKEANAVQGADDAAALLRRAVEEGPATSGEVLLESTDPALIAIADAGRHAERMALLEAMEARFPEAFTEEIAYFARMRFASAMERDDVDFAEEARRFGPHVRAPVKMSSPCW